MGANRVLVFHSLADSASYLTRFGNAGNRLGQVADIGYMQPRISPAGRYIAANYQDGSNGRIFLGLYDPVRGGFTPLSDRGNEAGLAWSRDGARLTYVGLESNAATVYHMPADGSVPPRVLLRGGIMRYLDLSPDGTLVFTNFTTGAPRVMIYSSSTRQAVPFGLMVVDFDASKKSAGAPRLVFQTRIVVPNYFNARDDVAQDGRIVLNSVPENYSSPFTLVTGWMSRLPR